MEKISTALQMADMHEKAGEFFEKMGDSQRALEAYVQGNAFRKAVDLAQKHFRGYVEQLEEQWGDWLVSSKQMEAAINHFVDAKAYKKAIEAAISARQWNKAIQLLGTQPPDAARPYYRVIAKHYADIRQLEQAEKFFLKANATQEIFEMYTSNNKWDQAYKFACKHMPETEVKVLYTRQASKLEGENHFKEAERMYLTVDEPDLAINMYKKAEQYDHMIRLVAKYRRELLRDTYIYLGQLQEQKEKYKEAEHYYGEAGVWNMAVDMYRKVSNWEDALRVAKSFGGPKEIADVARKWAETESVRGQDGSQLLIEQGLIEAALEFMLEKGSFSEAFRLAEMNLRHRLPDVHLRYALYLEDENRYKEAEEEFVRAGKPQEAINMYEHTQDFHSALRVARQFDPPSVSRILLAQGRFFLQHNELQKAEQCFISAKKPEEAIQAYIQAGMKNEALRLAREIAPHMLDQVMMMQNYQETNDDLLNKGKIWEQNRDYIRAIDAYLSVTPQHSNDHDALEECWERAVHLAMTYDKERCQQIVITVGQRLTEIKRFEAAAEMYAGIGQYEEALRCYIRGEDFGKAKELVDSVGNTEIHQRLNQIYQNEYRNHLSSNRNYGGMTEFDPTAGINMIIEGGDWETALQKARASGPEMLSEVLKRYTKKLTEEGHFSNAVKVFTMYGCPPDPSFFPIYKTLCLEILAECHDEEIYDLRTLLKNLLENFYDTHSAEYREFEKYLRIVQLCYLKSFTKNKGQHGLYTKICLSLLRYTNDIRVDRAFYDAGVSCQEEGWLNMAFVLLNRYIDLADAIDDPSSGMAALNDTTDYDNTDIPVSDISLPENNILSSDQRERLSDWLLQISMDRNIEQKLSTRHCDRCGREVYIACCSCPYCSFQWEPCLVTGFPVLASTEVACSNCQRPGNRADWSAYLTINSSCPWCSSIQSHGY